MAANYLPLPPAAAVAAAAASAPPSATVTAASNYLKAPPQHQAPNAMTIAIATQAPPLVLGTTALSTSNYTANCIPILTQPTDVTTLTGAPAALTAQVTGHHHATHAFIYPATAQPQH